MATLRMGSIVFLLSLGLVLSPSPFLLSLASCLLIVAMYIFSIFSGAAIETPLSSKPFSFLSFGEICQKKSSFLNNLGKTDTEIYRLGNCLVQSFN